MLDKKVLSVLDRATHSHSDKHDELRKKKMYLCCYSKYQGIHVLTVKHEINKFQQLTKFGCL